jgi:hypothetical protein
MSASIVLVSGGGLKQGTVHIDVLTVDEFRDSLSSYEKFYSEAYIGWKSPVIKDHSIQEIRNIIKKIIEKSNDDISEENKSIKDDDEKTKDKKSRFIEDSDYLYNFNITKIKQLLMKEFDFKNYTSFNKKEKEVKIKNIDNEAEKPVKVIKKKSKKDEEKNKEHVDVIIGEFVKLDITEKTKPNTTEKSKKNNKNDEKIEIKVIEVIKKKNNDSDDEDDEDDDEEEKIVNEKKKETPKPLPNGKTPPKKQPVKKNEALKPPPKKQPVDSGIKIKPIVKKIDSDSDDSRNVAEMSDTESNDSD